MRGGLTSRHFGANVVSGIGKLRVRTLCFLDAWLKSPTQLFVTFSIIRFLVSFAGVGRREYTVFGLLASFLNYFLPMHRKTRLLPVFYPCFHISLAISGKASCPSPDVVHHIQKVGVGAGSCFVFGQF